MTKIRATIVSGPFAVVSSGNTARDYMLDGDDIQERAAAAFDSVYYGCEAQVYQRGINGFGVQVEGSNYVVDVYTTREAAERALAASAQ